MEKFDLEGFPTSDSARKMLGYVSDGFYDKSYVGKWLFQVIGSEFDSVLVAAEELPSQFFLETATWGLIYHEIKWGLPVQLHLSYDERRNLIQQKRDFRAPMTPYRMEEYIKNALKLWVRIIDMNDYGDFNLVLPHPNVFRVVCKVEGTLDTGKLKNILDRIMQSHTSYIINDMFSAIIDSYGLEHIELRSVILDICIPFWNTKPVDTTGVPFKRNSHIGFTTAMERVSENIEGSIMIQKDLWYLDGEFLLDGTKLLDAELLEEVL